MSRAETDDLPQRTSAARMRAWATGALIVMTAVFVATYVWGSDDGVWGYVRAFAEAAMIGGLADWFAVTAIFRRPLGLPIPHTAVIPNNKERIAEAVGGFIADNFLEPDLVAERVAENDLSEKLGQWLADEEQSEKLARGLVGSLPDFLEMLDDEQVGAFIRQQVSAQTKGQRLAPAFGAILEALTAQNRHQALLDAVLEEGWRWLRQNEEMIRGRIRDETGWVWRLAGMDKRVSDSLIGALERILVETAHEPDHPLRVKLTETAHEFAASLRDDPEMQARIERIVREAITHPATVDMLEAGWSDIKRALKADAAEPETSELAAWLTDSLRYLGQSIIEQESARAQFNVRLRTLLVALAGRHGQDVSRIVSDTIRGWDAETIVEKLEANVGRDLQYIRLNGTLIGGLIGVLIHAGAGLL